MRKMKDSGYGYLGAIPENWKVERIKTHLRFSQEKNPGGATVLSLYREHGIVPKDSRDDNHNVTSEDTSNYRYVQVGDFVVNKMKAWQGSMAVSNFEGVVSPAYYVYRFIDDELDRGYLHYLLRSKCYADEFRRLSGGIRIGQWDLSKNSFETTYVAVPPLDEQKRIANTISQKLDKVDCLISNVQTQIEQLGAYKRSVITEKITMGLIGSVPTKESWIENQSYVPAHWNYVRGRYVAPVNKSVAMPDEDEYITYAPMECVRNDSFNPRAIQVKNLSSGLSSFAEGDVLLAKITPCFENGNVAIANNLINGVGAGSSELIAFTPIGINARFFMYYLQNTYFVESGKATIRGIGGLRRITSDFVENIALYIPDEIEQQEIVDYLDEKCSKIEALISIKQKKIEKLEQYKKSLIYEYVTGKKEVS